MSQPKRYQKQSHRFYKWRRVICKKCGADVAVTPSGSTIRHGAGIGRVCAPYQVADNDESLALPQTLREQKR